MRLFWISVLFVFWAAGNVLAEDCAYNAIYSQQYLEAVNTSAEIAKAVTPALERMQVLTKKAPSNNRPIMESLSKEELVEFMELSSKIKRQNLAQYVQSRRERDLSAIDIIYRLSERSFKKDEFPQEKDFNKPEVLPFVVFAGLEDTLYKEKFPTESITTNCTIGNALRNEAAIEFKTLTAKYSETAIAAVRTKAEAISAKKKAGQELTVAEQSTLENYQRMYGDYQFARALVLLAYLSDVSEFLHSEYQKDLYQGKEMEDLGKTMDIMIKTGKYPPEKAEAMRFWFIINDKVPSDFIRGIAEMSSVSTK